MLHDGEFWMNYNDFVRYFYSVEFYHLSIYNYNNTLTVDNETLPLRYVSYQSNLQVGLSAGGSGQINSQKYWTNPQFHVEINGNNLNQSNLTTFVVSLTQLYGGLYRQQHGNEHYEPIGFHLFRVSTDYLT